MQPIGLHIHAGAGVGDGSGGRVGRDEMLPAVANGAGAVDILHGEMMNNSCVYAECGKRQGSGLAFLIGRVEAVLGLLRGCPV